jgi:hypothetical protein
MMAMPAESNSDSVSYTDGWESGVPPITMSSAGKKRDWEGGPPAPTSLNHIPPYTWSWSDTKTQPYNAGSPPGTKVTTRTERGSLTHDVKFVVRGNLYNTRGDAEQAAAISPP